MVVSNGLNRQPQYNTLGEFACTNNGTLFSNNGSTSNDTKCDETAQWTRHNEVDCYTGEK